MTEEVKNQRKIEHTQDESDSEKQTLERLRSRLSEEADIRYQLESSNIAKDYRILQLKGWLRLFVDHPLFGTLIKLKKLFAPKSYIGPDQVLDDELDPDAARFKRQGYHVNAPPAEKSPDSAPDNLQIPSPLDSRLQKRLARRYVSLPDARDPGIRAASGLIDPVAALNSSDQRLPDVYMFPVIDWDFRFQRPQQLAKQLAERGHRVFYFHTRFSPQCMDRRFTVTDNPIPNIYTVKLHTHHHNANLYRDVPSPHLAADLAGAIYDLKHWAQSRASLAIVDLPFWARVANGLPAMPVVYDCMDYHAGFSTNEPDMLAEEEQLMHDADLVIFAADRLQERSNRTKPSIVVKNAADTAHFQTAYSGRKLKKRPVVGYYGAISDWFDLDLVLRAAEARPQYDFVLIGSTFGCELPDSLPSNVRMPGEVPYADIPNQLRTFDVCIIPFQLVELTRCTNPVKVYEYLAAGKPVVATNLPELHCMEHLVHVCQSDNEFISSLDKGMAETAPHPLADERSKWAAGQSWEQRGALLDSAVKALNPKVSVIVLVYNNLSLTRQCLRSIDNHTEYHNLEIVIVDNASNREVRDYLRAYATHREDVKLILNDTNQGFAGGNNAGLNAAGGDYVVILNNDTYVSEGWITRMLRHFCDDPDLGLLGPITNNIGDEAKVETDYESFDEMLDFARLQAFASPLKRLYKDKVAFFCVMMPRAVLENVGLLDESFGLGFFEDDDYCHRVADAGYSVAVAEDVFVHHYLSASFDRLPGDEKSVLFEKSKAVYEAKWGEWKPHRARPIR